MGKVTGFKEFERQDETYVPVEERVKHYKEFTVPLSEEQIKNTFDSKPKWQRASIMFAGPLANFLLSIFIFSISFSKSFVSRVLSFNHLTP